MNNPTQPVPLSNEKPNCDAQVQAQQQARQQALHIKQQADEQLLKLMLEQQSKLNEMIEILKQPDKSPKDENKDRSQKQVEQNLPNKQVKPSDAVQHSGTEKKIKEQATATTPAVPLQAVSVLQESNLDHLDVIMGKIQETLKTPSVPVTTTQLQGDRTDDQHKLDI